MKKTAQEILKFIDKSPTAYHVVSNVSEELKDAGFEELLEKESWKIKKGGKYFVTRNGSSIIAFVMPGDTPKGIRMAAAHSDSPCFKLKSNPEFKSENYIKLNTEKYGGMIMPSWLDRPLSIAGRVVVKNGDVKLVNLKKDVALIPNLAIHMNSDVNNGKKYDAQIDMLPIVGLGGSESKDSTDIMKLVAGSAKVKKEEILGSDLYLYNNEKGRIWGMNDEFISAPRLDDLQCAVSLMMGLTGSVDVDAKNIKNKKNTESDNALKIADEYIKLVAIFDNEEVGSITRQGADSSFLDDVIDSIIPAAEKRQVLANSFMISADNAHAVHPNHPEAADPTNRPEMNKGIVIKHNANQKYTTDALSEGFFVNMCNEAGVSVQHYCNKSNIPGGSTLGNISTSHVSVSTIDIGLPQLAMHSCYETAGLKDAYDLIKVLGVYWGY